MRKRADSPAFIGFLVLLAVLVAGCSAADKAKHPAKKPGSLGLNPAIAAPIESLGNDRATVAARLGTPLSTSTSKVPNRHDPQSIDKIHTLAYDGLSVYIYEATAVKSEFLLSVQMTINRPGLLPCLVGLSKDAIKAAFGTPLESKWDHWRFHSSGIQIGEDDLSLTFRGGRVTAAEWSFYLD